MFQRGPGAQDLKISRSRSKIQDLCSSGAPGAQDLKISRSRSRSKILAQRGPGAQDLKISRSRSRSKILAQRGPGAQDLKISRSRSKIQDLCCSSTLVARNARSLAQPCLPAPTVPSMVEPFTNMLRTPVVCSTTRGLCARTGRSHGSSKGQAP